MNEQKNDLVELLVERYKTRFGWPVKENGFYRVHSDDVAKGLRSFAKELAALQTNEPRHEGTCIVEVKSRYNFTSCEQTEGGK